MELNAHVGWSARPLTVARSAETDARGGRAHQEVTEAAWGKALEGTAVQMGLVGDTDEAPLGPSGIIMGRSQKARAPTRQEGRRQSDRKSYFAGCQVP